MFLVLGGTRWYVVNVCDTAQTNRWKRAFVTRCHVLFCDSCINRTLPALGVVEAPSASLVTQTKIGRNVDFLTPVRFSIFYRDFLAF